MKIRRATSLTGATALAFVLVSPAFAQDEGTSSSAPTGIEEIEVVSTGTLIRGIAPAASNVISVDAAKIETLGALSTVDLIQKIPQASSFLNLEAIQDTQQVQVSATAINLRNLPGTGGTLVLVDGHRLPGAGVKQTTPDPDLLPPLVIERLEVVTDGGAALYGADAVGGVVNFITKRSFEGSELSGHYGAGDKYWTYDVNGITGHDWGSGSAYAAFSYEAHDNIEGFERDFAKDVQWPLQTPADLHCLGGNVQGLVTNGFYTAGGVPKAPTFCDNKGTYRDYLGNEKRYSGYVGLSQEIGDRVTFDMKAYYTHRKRERDIGPRTSTQFISAATGSYMPLPFPDSLAPFNVSYINFGDVPESVGAGAGFENLSTNTFKTYGVTPSITVDLPFEWQLRAFGNYGIGNVEIHEPTINATALGTGIFLGTINPYDISANSAAVLAPVVNWELYGESKSTIANGKVVADGPIFELPGGDLRGAFGVEYIYEEYKARAGGAVPAVEGATLSQGGGNRNTYAAFGELNIPIVGDGNRVPGIYEFGVNLSGRFDSYTDFGDTLNPRVAGNYKPVDWVNFRGSWSTAFTAPSLADSKAVDVSVLSIPGTILKPNTFVPPPGSQTIAIQGGKPGLEPQQARIYSAGFDVQPPIIDGLSVSMTYYRIKYKKLISIPPVFAQVFFDSYPDLYDLTPTLAQCLALLGNNASATAVADVTAFYSAAGGNVASCIDGRRQNLGSTRVSGFDFQGDYTHDTNFGNVFASMGGTYRLTEEDQSADGQPWVDTRDNSANLYFQTTVGANFNTEIGSLLAQATVNYAGGYDITPGVANNNQSSVEDFKTVDLFFKYDIEGNGGPLTEDLSLTLGVQNLLYEDPPLYMGCGGGDQFCGFTISSGTVGRLFQFGIDKKF